MAWDDDKASGDELTSQEWDNHVADQKSRAKTLVKNAPPSTSTNDDGTLWVNSFVQYDSVSDLTNITDGDQIQGATYSESNDDLYFALAGGYVASINPSDGSLNWSHYDSAYLNAFMVAHNETRNEVYATVYDSNRVIALDASDGTFLWDHAHHSTDFPRGIVADEKNGAVYSGTDSGGEVVGADATDGSLLWSNSTSAGQLIDLAYNPDDGLVYTQPSGNDNEVFGLNESDGTINWTNTDHTSTGDNVHYNSEDSLVYTEGKYNSGSDMRLSAIDATSGVDSWVEIITGVSSPTRGEYDSDNNVIYIPTEASGTYAIDGYDGSVIWNNNVLASGEYSTSLAYATSNNNLYVGKFNTDSLVREIVQNRRSNLYTLLDGQWVINGN